MYLVMTGKMICPQIITLYKKMAAADQRARRPKWATGAHFSRQWAHFGRFNAVLHVAHVQPLDSVCCRNTIM